MRMKQRKSNAVADDGAITLLADSFHDDDQRKKEQKIIALRSYFLGVLTTLAICGGVSYASWRNSGHDNTDPSVDGRRTTNLRSTASVAEEVEQQPRVKAATTFPNISPEAWNLTHHDFKDYFGCYRLFESPDRPVDHSEIWATMRQVYSDVVNPDVATKQRLLRDKSAMRIPYTLNLTTDRGLTLFAAADIKNGTAIYDGSRGGHLKMTSGYDFKKFAFSLPDVYMTCLVAQCSQIESTTAKTDDRRKGAYISIDLDDGCFANADSEEQNVDSSTEREDCKDCDFALRDIEEGEELFWSYGDYCIREGWVWFDL